MLKSLPFLLFLFLLFPQSALTCLFILHNIKIIICCLSLLYRKFLEKTSKRIFICFTTVKIKGYKKVTGNNKFCQSIYFVPCSDFGSSFLKYKKFLRLGARKFRFLKYKKFYQIVFFYFPSSETYFLKYKKFPEI